MEMAKAAAGSPKKSSLEQNEHIESTNLAPQKTATESTFRIKSWKDQCASTPSLLRGSSKFTLNTKQDQSKRQRNSHEYKLSEQKQFQKQHICEHLNTHFKGQEIIERQDTQSSTLDLAANFTSAKRQGERCKEYISGHYRSEGKNGYTQLSSFQQRPTDVFTYRTGRHGTSNKSALHDKVGMSKYSQTISKEDDELMKSHTSENDLSTSTPDVCKNEPFHKNKMRQKQYTDSHQNACTSEKYCKLPEEPCARVINSKSHDLCQKCELRKTEKKTLVREKDACDSDAEFNMVKRCDPENFEQSEGTISDCCGRDSPVALLNDLNINKNSFFSENIDCISVIAKPAVLNIKEGYSHKESKLTDVSEMNSAPSFTSLVQNYEQHGNRSRQHTILAINKQTATSRYFQHQLPNIATSNMPDVTKTSFGVICSENVDRQNAATEISTQMSSAGNKQQFISASVKCPGENKLMISTCLDNFSMKNKIISLPDNCVMDTSEISRSLSLKNDTITRMQHEYFNTSSQGMHSDMKSNVSEEQGALFNQCPRSNSYILTKPSSRKEFCKVSVLKETEHQMTVQNLSWKQNEIFEHRDDQGYENEVNLSRNVKKLENPKSLKALSASCVIAENFKTVRTNSKCDENEELTDQIILDPTDSLLPKCSQQQTGINSRTSDCHAESKLHGLIQTTNLHAGRCFQTNCHPDMGFSNIRSSDSGSMQTSQNKPNVDSKDTEEHQACGNQTGWTTTMDEPVDKSSYFGTLLLQSQMGLEENECTSSLKLYKTSERVDKERNALNSGMEINENGSELQLAHMFTKTHNSDESSSYKPKNTQPAIRILPSECQSFCDIRTEQPVSEYNSQVLDKGSSKKYVSRPASATNSYEAHHQFSFPLKKSGNDTFSEGIHNYLTSSPSDIFSIRPYVDYTASKSTPNFVLSDQARSKTPDFKNSVSKSTSSEKLVKGRKHNGNRKGKSSSEKDSKYSYNSSKCMRHVSSSDDVENLQLNCSGKSRYNDVVRMRSQEQILYQPKNLRYSADSCSLISNAFLHKMARLSRHNTRPVSHPHIDDSQLHSTTKRTSIHGNSSKKIQDPNAVESDIVHYPSSSHFKMTSSASKNPPLGQSSSFNDMSQIKYEHRKPRSNPIETDDNGNGDITKDTTTSKLPLSKKAQSFFSKLTQSPISFFYRDSKPSSPPK